MDETETKNKDKQTKAIERRIDAIGADVFEKDYSPEDSKKELVEIEKNYFNDSFTFKEEKFINEYFIDGNEKEAAIRAGYSAWTAAQAATALMKNPKIKKEIEVRREKLRKRYEISPNRVLEEYVKLMASNIKDYFDEDGRVKDIHSISDFAAAAMESVELDTVYNEKTEKTETTIKKFKLVSKKPVLDSLSKYLGLFNDNDGLLLELGLVKLLKMFPSEMQESLKLTIMEKVQGKLLK